MITDDDEKTFLLAFLVPFPTLKIIDLALLITGRRFSPIELTPRIGAQLLTGDVHQVRRSMRRLRGAGLLDDRGRLTAEAVRLLDLGLGIKPAPALQAKTAPERPAVAPGDTRRSSLDFEPHQLVDVARAHTKFGSVRSKMPEFEARADFPKPIRNDSRTNASYFYSIAELEAWARKLFGR